MANTVATPCVQPCESAAPNGITRASLLGVILAGMTSGLILATAIQILRRQGTPFTAPVP